MRKYGFWGLVIDVILTCITGGLWLFWIVAREAVYLNKRV